MSIYKQIADIGPKLLAKHKLFKYGFNLSPMYRRSTGRIIEVSKDLTVVKMKLAISYKNRNYLNSIFGGSMFSAVDPIWMVQLINILGVDYVVWDKSAEITFKRPAKENLYAEFKFSESELLEIKEKVNQQNEMELTRTTLLTNNDKSVVYCEIKKRLYIAKKAFYKTKRKQSKLKQVND